MKGMTPIATALYGFWSSFGITAYPEFTVPDDAELPYITYELKQPNWRGQASYVARVWYRDTSFVSISHTVDLISDSIGEGKRLTSSGSIIYLFKDDNFIQMQPVEEEDKDLKIAYLSMIIHALA